MTQCRLQVGDARLFGEATRSTVEAFFVFRRVERFSVGARFAMAARKSASPTETRAARFLLSGANKEPPAARVARARSDRHGTTLARRIYLGAQSAKLASPSRIAPAADVIRSRRLITRR